MNVNVGSPKKQMRLMVSTLEGDYSLIDRKSFDSSSKRDSYDYTQSSSAVDTKRTHDELIDYADDYDNYT